MTGSVLSSAFLWAALGLHLLIAGWSDAQETDVSRRTPGAVGYSAAELARTMVRVRDSRSVHGMTAAQERQAAKKAGGHIDQLRHHSDEAVTEVEGFWIDKYPVTPRSPSALSPGPTAGRISRGP